MCCSGKRRARKAAKQQALLDASTFLHNQISAMSVKDAPAGVKPTHTTQVRAVSPPPYSDTDEDMNDKADKTGTRSIADYINHIASEPDAAQDNEQDPAHAYPHLRAAAAAAPAPDAAQSWLHGAASSSTYAPWLARVDGKFAKKCAKLQRKCVKYHGKYCVDTACWCRTGGPMMAENMPQAVAV